MVGSISFDNGIPLLPNVHWHAGGIYFLGCKCGWRLFLFWRLAGNVPARHPNFRLS